MINNFSEWTHIVKCWYHYYVETTSFPRNNDISITSTVPSDCDNGVHMKFRRHSIFVTLYEYFKILKKHITYINFLLSIFLMEYKDPCIIYCLHRKESGHQELWSTGLLAVSSWRNGRGLFAAPLESVTADQYQTNQPWFTHMYRCQQIMPSSAKVMACNLSGANSFSHHHNPCRLIGLWTNVSKYNQNVKAFI